MSKYNEDLDYLIQNVDISKTELEAIITEADKIISDDSDEKDKLIEAYLKNVQCLQKLNKYAESEEFLYKLLSLSPNMPEAIVCLGNFYDETQEYNKAIAEYNKAIELKSDYATAYKNRGKTKSNLYNYDDAIEDYNKAIELKPDYTMAYFSRGNTKVDSSDYHGAITDYTKVIEFKPDYAIAYNNRGVAYKNNGDLDCAIEDYDKAIELNPKYDLARNNRLNAYHAKDENLVIPLKKIRKNEEYMEDLRKNIKKVVPFLGAGASKPYGYYTWRGLLKEIFTICCRYDKVDSKDKDKIEKYIDDGDYIDAASEMDRIFPNVISAVCIAIESVADANCIEDVSRRSILSEYLHLFPNETCLTTNYDTVAKDILERQNKKVESVYPTEALKPKEIQKLPVTSEYSKLQKQELGREEEEIIFNKKVYYLHGVYYLPPSITLSKLHYDDYYGTEGDIKSNLRRFLPSALHGVYHNSIFLYIGCGMIVQQDRILKVVREFCGNLPNSPFSYALLNANEVAENAIKVAKNVFKVVQTDTDENLAEKILLDKAIEIAQTEELFENWGARSKEIQEKLNTTLKEKTDELRNMNVRVIWYSAPENSKDGHESAKRQLLKYILSETRERGEKEKKDNQRFEEEKAKIEAAIKKQERERLQAMFNNMPQERDADSLPTTILKEDIKEIILSEEQLKQVEEFFKDKIHVNEDSPTKHTISFPMYKIDGGMYVIYLVSGQGGFYLSDEGATIAELDKIFELSEPDVIKNLVAILKQYNCRKIGKNITIECTEKDIHIKMSHLIQAISFMLNMKIFYV